LFTGINRQKNLSNGGQRKSPAGAFRLWYSGTLPSEQRERILGFRSVSSVRGAASERCPEAFFSCRTGNILTQVGLFQYFDVSINILFSFLE
jgi:hypothetical protein